MTESIATEAFRLEEEGDPLSTIRGRIYSPPGAPEPCPGVLVLHGFKGFMDWGFFPELGRTLAQHGFMTIAFNMSGSGVGEDLETFSEDDAFARNSPSREIEDTERVRRYLEGGSVKGLDPRRLGLIGHSLGGGVALLHAERRSDYRAVVTWAAVARTQRFDQATVERWRERGTVEIPNARTGQVHRLDRSWLDDVEENGTALDVPAACARSTTPTLLLHGTADESVPYAEAESLAAALRPEIGRLVPIEGAGHTFGAVHPFAGPTPDLERAMGETVAFLTAQL